MTDSELASYLTETFPDVETSTNFGFTFFFYRSDHLLPLATMASADTEHDRISNLDRPGVFRLNIGVSRQTFHALFGAEAVDLSRYDWTALDTLMPHPHYAAQHFICVLSPGEATLEKVRALLSEAYEIAARRYAQRHPPAET